MSLPVPAQLLPVRLLPRQQWASEILRDLAAEGGGERISIGHIAAALGDRGYGIFILALTLPNLLPIPIPGLSGILGFPLIMLSVQMMLGLPKPWLPGFVLRRSLPREPFDRLIGRCLPYLERAERVLRPRWVWLAGRAMERVIGMVCLILAVYLALPIFLTGIPLATPLTLLGLGLFQRDGVFVAAGLVLAPLSIAFASFLGWAYFEALILLVARILGW